MQAFSSKVPGQKSVNKMAADIKKKTFSTSGYTLYYDLYVLH